MYKLEDSHFWFTGKRYFVDSILYKYSKKIKKILDIGSGTGGMTKHMSKYGAVTAVEQNPLALSLARKRGLNVVKGNANALKFKNNQFDLITIFDVLYHKNIKDEGKIIKDAGRFLKKHGLLLITDSAFDFLKSKHDVAVWGRKRYSVKQMVSLLETADFTILRASYSFMSLFPITVIKRLILERVMGSKNSDVAEVAPIFNSFLKSILKLESVLIKYTNLPVGTSVIVLARKN